MDSNSDISRAPGTTPATPDSIDDVKSSTAPVRILVVEDDAIIRNLLAVMLQGAGYMVDCAEDGEAGWDTLNTNRFDLLITDHDMPRLSGLDLLKRIRSQKLQLPVLFVSGKIPSHVPELAALLVPGAAIEKPFTMAQFLAHVRKNLATAMH